MELGDGCKARLWDDILVENGRMKKTFPRLYSLSCQKECCMGKCGFWYGVEWIWNFHWCRQLFQWELDLLWEIHNLIATVNLNRFSQDRLIWKFDKERLFSTKSLTKIVLANKEQLEGVNSYSFTKAMWKGVVPRRVELLA